MSSLSDYVSALNWRSATKDFDAKRKIDPDLLKHILEAPRLAPSSYGLQPWKFVVVEDPALRTRLKAHAWNQSQVTDASALIVLCSLKEIDKQHVDFYINDIAKQREVTAESLKGFREMMLGSIDALSPQANRNWATHQVYIALGMLLSACAISKIDACPMEGFDKDEFDKILELEKAGIASCVLCAVGYAKDTQRPKKVRFGSDQILIWR